MVKIYVSWSESDLIEEKNYNWEFKEKAKISDQIMTFENNFEY